MLLLLEVTSSGFGSKIVIVAEFAILKYCFVLINIQVCTSSFEFLLQHLWLAANEMVVMCGKLRIETNDFLFFTWIMDSEKCEQQAYLFQQMMKSENNCLTLTACMLYSTDSY